ncbi:MAG: cation diffusion facilitator family transporter [Candidatus Bipolaricaulota bacterium]
MTERKGFAADLLVAWSGAAANVALMGLKLGVGLVSGSVALVADGVHSLSDVATDLVVLGGLRIAQRPADENHAYGHGKFETLAAAMVALALGGAAVWLAWEAAADLAVGVHRVVGFWPLVVAAVSIAVKEFLYRASARVARASGSPATAANAWHHRSDALSSVAVLIGAAVALAGWPQGDRGAALVVAGLVALAAGRIMRGAVHDLTEGALSPAEQRWVCEAVQSVPGVRGWHALRTRRAGRSAFVDLHIEVDPQLSVRQAHEIASQVERAVGKAVAGRPEVVVHIEPVEKKKA